MGPQMLPGLETDVGDIHKVGRYTEFKSYTILEASTQISVKAVEARH